MGLPGGSITWWRNNGDGTYSRNNVITGVVGSYHGVVFADFDKDGVQDIVSVMEDGGFPSYPSARSRSPRPFAPSSSRAPAAGPSPPR